MGTARHTDSLVEPLKVRVEFCLEEIKSKNAEIAQNQQDLRRLGEESERLHIELKDLQRNLFAYQKALLAELTTSQTPIGLDLQAVLQAQDTEADDQGGDIGDIRKSDFLLKVIKGAKLGIRPSKIIAAFKKSGLQTSPEYVYTMLSRFKAKDRIKEEDGKYFDISLKE